MWAVKFAQRKLTAIRLLSEKFEPDSSQFFTHLHLTQENWHSFFEPFFQANKHALVEKLVESTKFIENFIFWVIFHQTDTPLKFAN